VAQRWQTARQIPVVAKMNAGSAKVTIEQAFAAGRRCGVQKLSSTSDCPFPLTQPWGRAAWLDGYASGQSEGRNQPGGAKQSLIKLLSYYRDIKAGARHPLVSLGQTNSAATNGRTDGQKQG
jgi:hypothetical protein